MFGVAHSIGLTRRRRIARRYAGSGRATRIAPVIFSERPEQSARRYPTRARGARAPAALDCKIRRRFLGSVKQILAYFKPYRLTCHLGRLTCITLCWIGLSLASLPAHAASDAADEGGQTAIRAEITSARQQIDALKSRENINKAVRQPAIGTYQQAISVLESAGTERQHSQQLEKIAAAAPQTIDKIRATIQDLRKPQSLDELRTMSAADLSSRIDSLRSNLSDAQSQISDLRDQLTQIAQRPDAARQQLSQARSALQSLATAADATPDAQSGGPRAAAQQTLVAARRTALNARIDRLQEELNGLDPRERLLEARRSLAEAKIASDNEALSTAQAALGQKQNASAKSLERASENKLDELRGAVKPISDAAQANLELTNRLTELNQQTENLSSHQAQQREKVDDLQRRLNLVQRQLEIGGGSVALGDVLRAQKRNLAAPALPFLFGKDTSNTPDVADAELQRFQLQQHQAELDDPAAMARRLARQADVQMNAGQQQSLTALLRQRRAIVDQLVDVQSRYINIGRDLDSLGQQYDDTLSSFNRLLDERLFWLPSFRLIKPSWPAAVVTDVPWAFRPTGWLQALRTLGAGVVARPPVAVIAFLAVALLVGMRRSLRQSLRQLAEPVGNVRHDTFWLTLRATVITVLLALPSVVLLLSIGYLMREAPQPGRFALAVAATVTVIGKLAFFIEPFVHVCRNNGLADRHFRWPPEARRGLHRVLRGLLMLLIAPTFFLTFTESFDDDSKRETLGRAAFMISSVVIAGFSWRLLHPRRGVLANVLGATNKSHWRLGYLWLPLAAGVPLVLCGMAGFGYYYTALQLETRFFYSAALLGACIILYSLIVRWVTIAERRLALARALRRREEAREARAAREAASAAGEGTPDNLDTLEIDLVQISEQSRGLIKVVIAVLIGAGFWLIWSDTLPALQLLNNVTLWQQSAQVNGQIAISHVTLGALLLATAVGVMTALAGRNLPGFLEITILRRFSMDPGSRYAMATLFQYAIVISGMLVAVGLIGLRWGSIQWLVAAISVGLGFGLQEIFANFVSGLVILFERPVRVGDYGDRGHADRHRVTNPDPGDHGHRLG